MLTLSMRLLANTEKSLLTAHMGIVVEKVLVFSLLKPFHVTGLFIRTLKTPENRCFSDVFRENIKRHVP